MRYTILLLCLVTALCSLPRKNFPHLSIPKRELPDEKPTDNGSSGWSYTISGNSDSTINIDKLHYSLHIHFLESKPIAWAIVGSSGTLTYDKDPRKKIVYHNPASPKHFHSSIECKKIGAFRKLTEKHLDDFLKMNKTAMACPECAIKDKGLTYATQFLLDDEKE